jgi:murein tripeptide amidase MpaA
LCVSWIDAGIHAREWIAPATALHFIRELETKYETDPVIQSMLDQLDWYIMPVMNPDGYEFTHTEVGRVGHPCQKVLIVIYFL